MRRWRRDHLAHRTIVYSACGFAALVVLILAFGYWRENIARAAEPAATVYDEVIPMSQLLDRVRPRAKALDAQAKFYESQGISQAATQLNLQRSRLPDQVLDSLIEDKLVRQTAADRGIVVTDEDIEARIRKEIAQQEAQSQPQPTATPAPSPDAAVSPSPTVSGTPTPTPTATAVPTLTGSAFETAYSAFLTRADISDSYYRELVRADVLKEKLRESMAANIPATEEQVHARHILLDSPEKVEQAKTKLASGTPFDQVARELSTDPGSKDKGGDLGWFGRGLMNPAFEQAAFTQEVGVVGEPFQSPNGTHIVQVLERDPARPLSKDQLDQRAGQAYQAWYTGLKGSADVKNQLTPEGRAWILRQMQPSRG